MRYKKRDKMKPKKSANIIHFKRRFFERYGLYINNESIKRIVKDIQNNRAEYLEKSTNTRSIWEITFEGNKYPVLYDKNTKTLITVFLYEDEEKIDMDRFVKPFVKIIGDHDYRQIAWFNSRPYLKDEISGPEEVDLEQFETMDLSLAAMRMVTMEVYSSAGFRELIFGLRPYFTWSATSRVNPILETQFPSYLDEQRRKEVEDRMDLVIANIDKDIHQDLNRLNLTLGYMGMYTLTLDFRTLIGTIKWIKKYVPLYFEHYGLPIEKQLKINVDDYDYGYPVGIDFPSEGGDEFIRHSDNSIYQTIDISIGMRAQLVRHSALVIKDSLPSEMMDDVQLYESRGLDSSVRVSLNGPEGVFENMVKHRVCYLAQIDMWSVLTLPWIKESKSIAQWLPCSGNGRKCRYKEDMKGRIEGKDPGMVCPLVSNDESTIDKHKELIGDSGVIDYYRKLIK